MTSACIFKDALRNHTQVILEFRNSIFEILFTSHLTSNALLTSHLSLMRSSGAGTSNEIPLQESRQYHDRYSSLYQFYLLQSVVSITIIFLQLIISVTMSIISLASDDSDVFYVEQSSSEPSPQRHNSPNILNSTEVSEQHTVRMPSVSSIASPEPRIFTIDDDSNEPTIPYGFGRQLPIVPPPPSLNDLNLPPNPFNILMTMAIANNIDEETHDGNYSPE